MDRCRWEEFLRLISFIFVRLIIQFRLYVVDRFQIITYVHYIYIYVFLYSRVFVLHAAYPIPPHTWFNRSHTFLHSTPLHIRIILHAIHFYILAYFISRFICWTLTHRSIFVFRYITPPIRAVLIYSQESYTYRVLLISVDAIFIIFFFTLSPLPFFINLRSFFHPCDPISHIQRPSSRSVKYHSDEFVGIFSDRKYHNYRGIIKNRLDQRQRWFRLRFEVARTPSLSPFSIPSSTLSGGTAGEGACK